ncbi:MAG TPA: CoA-binding protein [Bacteroidales bacterium]|nr:CoA-binding protein [Bacteroidales bacterium]
MTEFEKIQGFLSAGTIAMVGASRNKKKFGNQVLNELQSKGVNVLAVHSEAKEINGQPCFSSISELPSDVNHLFIAVQKDQTAGVVEEAAEKGIKNIWIQQMSDTPEAIKLADEKGLYLISKRCIFMYADPVKGVHKFHRTLNKLFGTYAK